MMTGSATSTPLLTLGTLSKTFNGVKALSQVDLEILPGQVHGLLGENGSGKSTLIKILSGTYAPDPGATGSLRGTPFSLPIAPGYYRQLGISFVHQDLALVPELSVVENLRMSSIVAGKGPFINWRGERRLAAELFKRYGLSIDPTATVGELNGTERALVAIMRAVSELGENRSLLVLDEPTVFLPREDTDLLFRLVKDLVADGSMSVLLVSHDLSEVLEYTDRVTVLRAGLVQASAETSSLTVEKLIELIVGRELVAVSRQAATTDQAAPIARVVGARTDRVKEMSFDIGPGEIIGITGLAGSGFEDILGGIYGAIPATAGRLTLAGTEIDLTRASPVSSIAAGIVFVPADRKTQGGAGELSVEENVTLPVLAQFRRWFGLSSRAMTDRADELAKRFDVRPRDSRALFSTLSGGNQQKAVLGKWLQNAPTLVLLQEPTQGVDVGARSHIFSMLRTAAATGVAVVCASSDYDQLASVCDRVMVLAHGRIQIELAGDDVTRETLATAVIASLAESIDAEKERAA